MTNEEEILLHVPANISKITTFQDRTLRLNVDTSRELSPEENAALFQLNNKEGFFIFKLVEITYEDLIDIPDTIVESDSKEKSPSQILRNRLFVTYKGLYGKSDGFTDWYKKELDRIGQHYLSKLK